MAYLMGVKSTRKSCLTPAVREHLADPRFPEATLAADPEPRLSGARTLRADPEVAIKGFDRAGVESDHPLPTAFSAHDPHDPLVEVDVIRRVVIRGVAQACDLG